MQGQRLHKVLKTEPTIKQRSRWAEAASRPQHASTQSLKAPSHQLETVAQALEAELAESKKLRNAILHQGVHAFSDCRKDMACVKCSLDSCNSLRLKAHWAFWSWALMLRDRHMFAPEMALLIPLRACWLTRLCAGAGVANEILQALQDDGRQRALAHVGIYSTAIAPDGWPWGDRIPHLVEDWGGHGGTH